MPDPIVTGSLIQGGAGFLESIADQIFGGGDRRRREEFLRMLQERMGRDVISPQRQRTLAFQAERAGEPQRQRFAEQINRRLGLDTGAAQGELLRFQTEQGAQFRQQLGLEAERLRAQADRTNLGLQAGLVGGGGF